MNTPGPSPYSASEQQALAAIVARIIPADAASGQPGADDPDILRDILTSGAHLRDALAPALASLSGEIDDARTAAFRQAFPSAAEMLQTLTVQCYYRDTRVLQALGIEARAPFPVGYAREPNDLSLLDPVRRRGEIYRRTP